MPEQPTRLRYIAAKTLEDLELAINALPVKIEIKGNPVRDKTGWVIFFVPPDSADIISLDLRKV